MVSLDTSGLEGKASARRAPQPLGVLEIAEALLDIRTVCAITALSKSSIYREVATGAFPAPIRRGTRCTRWVSRDVSAWLKAQGAGREFAAGEES